MHRHLASVIVLGVWLASAGLAWSQETPAAKATRKRLQEKISVEIKETGFKEAIGEIRRELNNKVSFKIDTVSGLSNNSKVTVIAKDKTVEAILNELADKYDFGYYIMTNVKDRLDGWIIVRKHKDKERGYEAGKEPKKEKGALLPPKGNLIPGVAVDRPPQTANVVVRLLSAEERQRRRERTELLQALLLIDKPLDRRNHPGICYSLRK